MTVQEIKKFLNGCEINSLSYEGIVYVSKGIAYSEGKEIKVNWKTLYNEYAESELSEYFYMDM